MKKQTKKEKLNKILNVYKKGWKDGSLVRSLWTVCLVLACVFGGGAMGAMHPEMGGQYFINGLFAFGAMQVLLLVMLRRK